MAHFNYFTADDALQRVQQRDNETKLGQSLHFAKPELDLGANLDNAKQLGIQFIILGLSDDSGPQANLGRAGASGGFQAAMQQWLNLQANAFFDGKSCMVLGELQQTATASADISTLRQATAAFDQAVTPLLSEIFKRDMQAIVIGGGHNNAYGIIKALSQSQQSAVAAINLDPHCDFRPLEGRHSGNGFSYAAQQGYLQQYHILGLHELKNSQASLEQLAQFDCSWHTLQQIWIRHELSLEQACEQALARLNKAQLPLAIELDVDAISHMPASATTVAGIPLLDACHYLHYFASHAKPRYLHIAEAAPNCHQSSTSIGIREVGQSISELIYAYIKPQLI